MKNPFRRPSPAMVVAVCALVVALGGSATAAGFLIDSSKDIKSHSIAVSDLSRNAVKELRGHKGSKGSKGAQGPAGAAGAAGAPGSALAYAHVNTDGTVDRAKNVATSNVTKLSNGFYCFSGLQFTPTNAVATVDYETTVGGTFEEITTTTSAAGLSLVGCGPGAQVGVGIFNATTGANRSFFILFN
jgi:hypothetical protein